MSTCFVIQPFDSGKFDKRFDGIYRPAIEDAGLEAYRVDRDPHVEVPIDSIEDGIKNASICLADITTDNPNVWYELGFAFAARRPVIMVCSDERTSAKYPFDIQHRTIITYSSEAPSDFTSLQSKITEKIKALLNKNEMFRQLSETEQVTPNRGLSQLELIVLAGIAGETGMPESTTSTYSLKQDAERAGLTAIGFSLAYRRLIDKKLIETIEDCDFNGNTFTASRLTEIGWNFIENNEVLFVLNRNASHEQSDDIPF